MYVTAVSLAAWIIKRQIKRSCKQTSTVDLLPGVTNWNLNNVNIDWRETGFSIK